MGNKMENRKEAMEVIAEMNKMLLDRPIFGDVVRDAQFKRLRDRLHGLGWLGLCKSLEKGKDGLLYAQLRLEKK